MKWMISLVAIVVFSLHSAAQEKRDYFWFSGNVVEDTTSFSGVNKVLTIIK